MSRPNVEPLVDKAVIAILRKQGFNEIGYVPRNLYDPDALFDSLELYAPEYSRPIDFEDNSVKAGRDIAFKAFAKPKHAAFLEAIRLDGPLWKVYDLLEIKGDRSAGLTAYGMTKQEAFPVAMRKVVEILTQGKKPDPCLAGVRTQAGKLGRLIWGYPMAVTILEGLIARPLLNHYLNTYPTPMAFGLTSVEIGIKMRKAVSHTVNHVSVDASKFDSSIQAGVIKFGFNCLRTWFDPKQEVGYGATVEDIFNLVEDYFIRTPIVMPTVDGPVLYKGKRHGVPSGSYFTQLIDSIASTMFVGTLDFNYKLKLRLDEIMVLGDDILFFTNKALNLSDVAETLEKLYGMKVNVSKSVIQSNSESIPFLGRKWRNGLPLREFRSVVERAVSPERYRNYGREVHKGASAVIASYGFTAMIVDLPMKFDPYQGLHSHAIAPNSSSGLTEFMLKEGLIINSMKSKLY
jgi:hypothetical protein